MYDNFLVTAYYTDKEGITEEFMVQIIAPKDTDGFTLLQALLSHYELSEKPVEWKISKDIPTLVIHPSGVTQQVMYLPGASLLGLDKL